MGRDFTVETNGVYRSGNLVMVPRPTERILAHLFYNFESDGLLDVIWHEGERITLRWFLEQYMSADRSTLLCYRQTPGGPYDGHEPVGMGWVNRQIKIGARFLKAEFGTAFLRKTTPYEVDVFGELMLSSAFDNLPVDTLLGVSPAPNRAVSLLARRFGFVSSGEIPGFTVFDGKLCGAVIQSLTRTRWNQIQSERRRSNAA